MEGLHERQHSVSPAGSSLSTTSGVGPVSYCSLASIRSWSTEPPGCACSTTGASRRAHSRCNGSHRGFIAGSESGIHNRRPAYPTCCQSKAMSKHLELRMRSYYAACSELVACLLLSGCERAPSINVLGSFFPAWILCIASGIFLSIGAHFLLVHTGL